MLQVFLLV